ncbi:hypothetical protein NPS01_25140 [Nocardioides psychrotolerans]|uniref:Uncharacterized protein n=1 Tax=Nocardioides psychrotolerans TaxID=1005945 RepID=A0A1I3LLS0_9ACTN|nr:hypothetical protein [Nocardioides psychrotolerans]GEP38851.1 hypothetical protein NPS01_25140 [Nocardioides psychrotolerans]SFI85490.1 hypothetical protein SAMN05216561_11417 [Nocardioides psychrotolerans]
MPTTYAVAFHARRGTGSVEITVPDNAEPLDYLAHQIARELDLMRFEIQIGSDSGHIRLVGDDGPGTAFSFTPLQTKDS